MAEKYTQPTVEALGKATDLIMGASGSGQKDEGLDDGFWIGTPDNPVGQS